MTHDNNNNDLYNNEIKWRHALNYAQLWALIIVEETNA